MGGDVQGAPADSGFRRKICRGVGGVLAATVSDRKIVWGLLLGQALSLLITGTGVTSQLLAADYDVNIPTTQSSINYLLLFLVYMPTLIYQRRSTCREQPLAEAAPISSQAMLAHRAEEEAEEPPVVLPSVAQVLRTKWWFYLLLAIADVEANFLVVKAYQYTTITSVMLLDCFSIPCVMVLTFIFLKARYSIKHYLGVTLCLGGLVALVVSDAHVNHYERGENAVVGDLLCLGGAMLYAISNVGQESVVKQFDRVEYLAMLGLFGSGLNVVQSIILERTSISSIDWSLPVVGLLVAFGLCLFAMYSLTPYMLLLAGATVFNLSLLTSDVYAIIAGIFIFNYVPSGLYFLAFAAIVAGLLLYNVRLSVGENINNGPSKEELELVSQS